MGQSQLTGVAGVHFVTAYLSHLGLIAMPTIRNVCGTDILVSNARGSKSVTLQVKTTVWAMRTRGRGDAKQPYECQWDIGWPSAKHSLVPFFVLVDLKNFAELPDCYIVPLRVIRRYFKRGPKNWPRARYHERIEKLAPFKNKWALLKRALRSR